MAFAAATITLAALSLVPVRSADTGYLQLEGKIPLGAVRGRIDHMTYDPGRQRLFVAELGNDSVGVVDLARREAIHTIRGLAEPQGIGYVPSADMVYVANARDGSVRLFHGTNYTTAGRIDLGSDADNVRFDASSNHLLVGYGSGAIASLDIAQQNKRGEVPLSAHPESFQIGRDSRRLFVNLPEVHAVGVLDRISGVQSASWRISESGNFPMALDNASGRILIVSRNPSKVIVLSQQDGSRIADAATCGDADDIFVDAKRGRVYVSCGDGYIDVFAVQGNSYTRAARIETIGGARTSFFVPDLDLFLLGARASGSEGAAIWVYRALP
jgi:DNA-binding beta-propeller fold protein YncE